MKPKDIKINLDDWKSPGRKCPSLLSLPGKDLLKVTTDSLILNNNSVWKKNSNIKIRNEITLKIKEI